MTFDLTAEFAIAERYLFHLITNKANDAQRDIAAMAKAARERVNRQAGQYIRFAREKR